MRARERGMFSYMRKGDRGRGMERKGVYRERKREITTIRTVMQKKCSAVFFHFFFPGEKLQGG